MSKNIVKEIHVYLTGRLGNQLFQYSFAKRIQKEYGGKIFLNVYELEHRSEKMKHVPGKFFYDMKNYRLDSEITLEDIKPRWFAFIGNYINKICRKFFPKLFFRLMCKKGYLIWLRSEYIEIPKLKSDKIFICGWWQHYEYYKDIDSELKELIVPTTNFVSANSELYKIANSENSVCISIRGGNYLVPEIKNKLFVCDKNYFYRSIEFIKTKIKNPLFIVFSDDLRWVREEIKLEEAFPDDTFYYESGNDTVEEKMRMMTSCKNFIISNSSFSWWAQFLCENDNKVVVAPSAWHTNGLKNGLYMQNWYLINVCNKEE